MDDTNNGEITPQKQEMRISPTKDNKNRAQWMVDIMHKGRTIFHKIAHMAGEHTRLIFKAYKIRGVGDAWAK